MSHTGEADMTASIVDNVATTVHPVCTKLNSQNCTSTSGLVWSGLLLRTFTSLHWFWLNDKGVLLVYRREVGKATERQHRKVESLGQLVEPQNPA